MPSALVPEIRPTNSPSAGSDVVMSGPATRLLVLRGCLGDARVVSAGWQGGYGNAVVLDHGRGYTTLYGHMSRLGKIKRGQRIAQGTVIGYVGTSGMSTGPHLHYEFKVNGAQRNPLSITMPPPEPLSGVALAQFRQQTSVALTRIRKVENIIYADAGPAPQKLVAAVKPASKKG